MPLFVRCTFLWLTVACLSCHEPSGPATQGSPGRAPVDAPAIRYHLFSGGDSTRARLKARYNPRQLAIIAALNRMDFPSMYRSDTLLVPDTLLPDLMAYSPFPASVSFLEKVRKLVFFSYPAQAFGAYEYGQLRRWGPTSMGRKKDPTPTGLFFTNWKAEETRSTFDDEWLLKWNFNIENKLGVGWHQYAMPGYPASHSCLRLREEDARYLYDWAEQWILKNEEQVLAPGTPVIVFGSYPFGHSRPWRALATDPAALRITEQQLQEQATPFLDRILKAQALRDSLGDTGRK